jgi:hypothetical protein
LKDATIMLGITLALLAAVGYGASDFAGGLLSRRSHFLYVGLVGQATSAFLAIALALIQAGALPGGTAIIW